jgi:hypothetical protein
MSKDRVQTSNTKQDALRSYLDYYRNLKRPGFAVLVTGEWGSGKTHQVRNLISENERCYVSLFGLASKEEIHAEILGQLYPADKKARKEADAIAKFNPMDLPIGTILAGAIRRSLRTKLNESRLIIFDDVERCSIAPRILLGLINELIEHDNCHVLIIAHEKRFADEFSEAKEKIIGHTIALQPKTNEAFDSFASEFKPIEEGIFVKHRVRLLELFSLSNCQSLRVLRQALMGVQRFCEILDEEQIANTPKFERLLSLYFAISIEVLRGDLSREHLVHRPMSLALAMQKDTNAAGPYMVSHGRFASTLEISNFDLSDQLLIQMIVDGQYDKVHLQSYLSENQIFEEPAEWSAWRRFMSFDSLPDSEVNQAADEMDKQFQDREVTDIGELMHIVSLRIMRVKEGLLAGSKDEVVDACMKYLDDLLGQDRFPLNPNIEVFSSHPSHGGVMLWGYEENRDAITEIRDHVFACEKQTLKRLSPSIKVELLAALNETPEKLGTLLNVSDGPKAKYQTVPVMLSVPVKEFVDAFLSLPVENWEPLRRVLNRRLSMISSNNSLSEEENWFSELELEMLKIAEAQSGSINKLRIKHHIPNR